MTFCRYLIYNKCIQYTVYTVYNKLYNIVLVGIPGSVSLSNWTKMSHRYSYNYSVCCVIFQYLIIKNKSSQLWVRGKSPTINEVDEIVFQIFTHRFNKWLNRDPPWRSANEHRRNKRQKPPHTFFTSAWLCQQSWWNRNSSVDRPSVVRLWYRLSLKLLYGFLSNFTCGFPWAMPQEVFWIFEKNIFFYFCTNIFRFR